MGVFRPQREATVERDLKLTEGSQSDVERKEVLDKKHSKAEVYVKLLRTKEASKTLVKLQQIVAHANATHEAKVVLRVHSDRGGEFANAQLEKWPAESEIHPTTTEGRDPAGNGLAERFVGLVKQTARALLVASNLPTYFWPFAVKYAALVRRRAAQGKPISANWRSARRCTRA